MKRLIIAVCMLITGIAISIGGYVNLKSICRNMSYSVNEVIRAAENGDADETKRKCDDTEKMWYIKITMSLLKNAARASTVSST